jgi:protein-S-isoprenylcysteine O-methyltransferase Ste14
MSQKSPSLLLHLRDWLALPFVVTVIIPFLLYRTGALLMQRPPEAFGVVGAILYVLGLSMQLYTTSLFWRFAQGTLAPWQPTQKLVIRGPYRYCRNPMITGVVMMLIGEGLFFNALAILIWGCVFFVMNTMYFIFKEEPAMLARFGDSYAEYKKDVPRWLPRVRPYRG